MTTLKEQGITALRGKDIVQARRLLEAAVKEDPSDAEAWLWLSGAVNTDRERAICLQQVLRLEPDNPLAARGLAKLVARGAVTVHPPASAPPPETGYPEAQRKRASSAPPEETTTATRRAGQRTPNMSAAQESSSFVLQPSLRAVAVGLLLSSGLILAGFLFASAIRRLAYGGAMYSVVIVLFFIILGLGLGWSALKGVWWRSFTRYTLTDRHLIVQKGAFARARKIIPIHRIQDVSYAQSLVQRLVGIGDIIVESAGERGSVRLRDIPRYQEYVETILDRVQQDIT